MEDVSELITLHLLRSEWRRPGGGGHDGRVCRWVELSSLCETYIVERRDAAVFETMGYPPMFLTVDMTVIATCKGIVLVDCRCPDSSGVELRRVGRCAHVIAPGCPAEGPESAQRRTRDCTRVSC